MYSFQDRSSYSQNAHMLVDWPIAVRVHGTDHLTEKGLIRRTAQGLALTNTLPLVMQ
jgi:hypothetical protein